MPHRSVFSVDAFSQDIFRKSGVQSTGLLQEKNNQIYRTISFYMKCFEMKLLSTFFPSPKPDRVILTIPLRLLATRLCLCMPHISLQAHCDVCYHVSCRLYSIPYKPIVMNRYGKIMNQMTSRRNSPSSLLQYKN